MKLEASRRKYRPSFGPTAHRFAPIFNHVLSTRRSAFLPLQHPYKKLESLAVIVRDGLLWFHEMHRAQPELGFGDLSRLYQCVRVSVDAERKGVWIDFNGRLGGETVYTRNFTFFDANGKQCGGICLDPGGGS